MFCTHTHRHPGTTTNCLNLGSYNYLGFAENRGPCADASKEATYKYGAAVCSSRRDFGEILYFIQLSVLYIWLRNMVGEPELNLQIGNRTSNAELVFFCTSTYNFWANHQNELLYTSTCNGVVLGCIRGCATCRWVDHYQTAYL